MTTSSQETERRLSEAEAKAVKMLEEYRARQRGINSVPMRVMGPSTGGAYIDSKLGVKSGDKGSTS